MAVKGVTEREAREYQEALKTNNRAVLNRLGAVLIDRNMGLVVKTVEKLYRNRAHQYGSDAREDLICAGTIGLLKTLQDFHPGRAQFSTIATYRIWHEVQQCLCKMQVTSHPKANRTEFRAGSEEYDADVDRRTLLAWRDGSDPADDLEEIAKWTATQPDDVQLFVSALLCGEEVKRAAKVAKLTEERASEVLGQLRAQCA